MKLPVPQKTDARYFRLGVIFLFCAILAQIVFLKPFFGLMDDASLLTGVLPGIYKNGFWHSYFNLKDDITWGMFRPNYIPMIYLLYSTGLSWGPTVFFILNAWLVFLVLYLNALAFSKLLKVNLWVILLFALIFPYTYDLFQHPSMQEKLVMLFGSLLLLASASNRLSGGTKLALILFLSAMGFGSKASFLIYALMTYAVLVGNWIRSKDKSLLMLLGAVTIFDLGFVLFLKSISAHGSYTARYSYGNLPHTLLTPRGLFYSAVVFIATAILLRRERPFVKNINSFTAVLGVFGFLVVFLPWSLEGYLQSIVALPLASTAAQFLEPVIRKHAFLGIAVFLLALAVGTLRAQTMFNRLHDIGVIVRSGPQFESQGVEKIFVPCEEGSESMKKYFQLFSNSAVTIERLLPSVRIENQALFFDNTMCPLLDRSPLTSCQVGRLYRSRLSSGYEVVKIGTCSQ